MKGGMQQFTVDFAEARGDIKSANAASQISVTAWSFLNQTYMQLFAAKTNSNLKENILCDILRAAIMSHAISLQKCHAGDKLCLTFCV